MENNELMNNEEVIETTEEIVKTTSNSKLKVATIGLAMIAGGLTYKFVVSPAVVKFKSWRENRKAAKQEDNVIDGKFKEVDEDEL